MTDPKEAKRHHYVSAFYLAGFTIEGKRDSSLYTTDLEAGGQRESTPDKEGYVKNYNRAAGDTPLRPESLVTEIEGKAAPVVKQLCQTGRMPTGTEYESLMAFVASLLARGRVSRAIRVALRKVPPEHLSAEFSSAIINSDLHIEEEEHTAHLARILANRHWVVRTVSANAPPTIEFVTSDCPVLSESRDVNVDKMTFLFPVSRRAMIRGTLVRDGNPSDEAKEGLVAEVNRETLRQTFRYVWSRRPRFPYRWDHGQKFTNPIRVMADRRDPQERADFMAEQEPHNAEIWKIAQFGRARL